MFDFFVFLIFALVQSWISIRLRRFIARRAAAVATIVIFNVVACAGFACSFSDKINFLLVPPQFAMIVGAVALGYTLIAAGMLAVYLVVGKVRESLAAKVHPDRRRVIVAAGNALMAGPFVAMSLGFVKRLDFHVREVDVPVPGLPKDLEGLRILQLSDIHLGPFLSEADLGRVIDACKGLHPHLVVITGDLISQRGDPLDACIRQLARVKADAGVYGCMGNHERYARAEEYTEMAAARVGIRFLRQRSQALRFGNATLNLAGVDHQVSGEQNLYLLGAEQFVLPGATNVLLSHNPDVFPVATLQGYNLLLSGHTHGGQVTVEILDQSINPARFLTPYVYGVYRSETASAYVTRGIGTIGIPARIGAPPEIALLRLRKA